MAAVVDALPNITFDRSRFRVRSPRPVHGSIRLSPMELMYYHAHAFVDGAYLRRLAADINKTFLIHTGS